MMILATFSSCCCYEYEFWLPFPPAAAEAFAAAAGPRIRKHHGIATFSSCCCYEFWLPFPPAAAEAFAAAAAGPRIGKHHGSEGEAPKLHPENA